MRYSSSLLATRIVGFGYTYGAEFLIGLFLGLRDVGYYRVSNRIVSAVAELVFEPTRVLSWGHLAQTQRDAGSLSDRLKDNIERVIALALFAALPAFFGLAAIAGPLVSIVMGPDWVVTAPVIALLAIARITNIPSLLTDLILTLGGQISRTIWLTIIATIISLSATAIAGMLQAGPVGVAVGQIVAGTLSAGVAMAVQQRTVRWRTARAANLSAPAFGGAMAMIVSILAIGHVLEGSPLMIRLFAEIFGGACAYLVLAGAQGIRLVKWG